MLIFDFIHFDTRQRQVAAYATSALKKECIIVGREDTVMAKKFAIEH